MTIPEHDEARLRRLEESVDELGRTVTRVQVTTVALERDMVAMREVVPKALGETLGRLDERLSSLASGQGDIMEALRRGYVTMAEFDPIKERAENALTKELFHVEMEPIKRVFWTAMAAVITGIVAILWEVIRHISATGQP